MIKNMYWEQTAAMQVDEEIGFFRKKKCGVRQGCVLSPGNLGIKVGGHSIL